MTKTNLARISGLLVAASGVAALIGWAVPSVALRSAFGLSLDVNPVVAVTLVLTGAAICILTLPSAPRAVRELATVAALAVVAIAVARLGALVFEWPIRVDGILFSEALQTAPPNVAEMASGAAFITLVLGLALLHARFAAHRWETLARSALVVASVLPLLVCITFLIRLLSGEAVSTRLLPLNSALAWLFAATGLFALGADRSGIVEDNVVIGRRMNGIITLAVGILVITCGVAVYTGLSSIRGAHEADRHRIRSAELAMLLSALQDAESGQRGFILSEQEAFLAPYRVGLDSVPRRLERVRDAFGEAPEQRERLASLARAIDARMTTLASNVVLQQNGKHTEAVAQVSTGVGDSLMQAIRTSINTMMVTEDSALLALGVRQRRMDTTSLLTNLFFGLLAITFLGLAGRTITTDMRKRALAEAAVRNSEKQLAQVIDLVPFPLLLKDPRDLRLTSVNVAALDLLGLSKSETHDRTFFELFPGPEAAEWAAQDREVLESESMLVVPEEVVMTRHRGERILHTRKVALRDDAGKPTFLLCVSEDITDRKRNEKVVTEAREAAEKANSAKSHFLAKMSHELRTPLNSIIGFSEILEDEGAGPLNVKQRRFVSNVLLSGRNLLALINDILDLSRIEAGRMDLTIEEVDVHRVAEQVKGIISAIADRKDLVIESSISPDVPSIAADPVRLKQILFNLLGNAIKFTPEHGRVTMAATVVEPTEAGVVPMLEIAVTDTGVGIAPEDQERMFREFVQVGDDSSGGQQGTGLGLAITKSLVEMHGGRLWVESAIGVGSTFRFTMPTHANTSDSSAHTDQSERPMPGAPWGPRVLVVENDPQARDLITHHLREQGYRVYTAGTAADAVRMARAIQPHAITLDIVLPDRDGLAVLAQLKQDATTRGIPVVVVSITDRREVGFSLGASDWLVKPVDRGTLVAAIKAITGDRTDQSDRKVLIVDDEEQAREYVRDLLTPLGFTVLMASGGREGIAMVQAERPDLLILDLMMPDMNGFQVVEALRSASTPDSTPILVLTGKELTEADRVELRRTVNAVVRKGGRDELLAQLSAICSAPAIT